MLRAETYEEGLALINASPFGNGTAIFTRDGGAARRFQLEVEAGMVGVNVPIPVPVGYHSFGGWKDSLFGDHHIYGNDGVHFYTRGKVVTTRWPDPPTPRRASTWASRATTDADGRGPGLRQPHSGAPGHLTQGAPTPASRTPLVRRPRRPVRRQGRGLSVSTPTQVP